MEETQTKGTINNSKNTKRRKLLLTCLKSSYKIQNLKLSHTKIQCDNEASNIFNGVQPRETMTHVTFEGFLKKVKLGLYCDFCNYKPHILKYIKRINILST